jgi:hypothetical protein
LSSDDAGMKSRFLNVATAALAVMCFPAEMAGEAQYQLTLPQSGLALPATVRSFDLGEILIQQKQAPWHEQPFSRLAQRSRDAKAAREMARQLYQKRLISRRAVESFERAAIGSPSQRENQRHAAAQRNVAPVKHASSAAKGKRSAARKRSGRVAGLIRHTGAADWTIDDIGEIDAFFRRRFGRPLPISALGQSATHDRLGLDHSGAADVAVRPGSAEGRALIGFLRAAGIPFTAFRGRVLRMSTGPHIHIGPPSPRLTLVKGDPEAVEKSAEPAG